jgi:hypothetical protein
MHGVKTAKTGIRLLDKAKVTAQAPRNLRTVIQAEGKDNYQDNKKNMAPMFPVIDYMAANGVEVEGTKYTVKQSLGATKCSWEKPRVIPMI